MTGPVFIAHPRPVWKVVVYQLITLGVYGRVWLYRSVKELDGHKVWFLDLNLYLVGVILPIGGPYVVKWRLAELTAKVLAPEVTMRPVHVTALRWAALLPWIPLYHGFVQRHLKRYWTYQRKVADLEGRREMLEDLRKAARSEADKKRVKQLEGEVREREQALESARLAAVALREAERARRETEERVRLSRGGPGILRRAAGRLNPMSLLDRFRNRGDEPASEPVGGAAGGTSKRAPAQKADEAPEEAETVGGGRLAGLTRRLPFMRRADQEEAEAEAAPKKRGKAAAKTPAKAATKQDAAPEADDATKAKETEKAARAAEKEAKKAEKLAEKEKREKEKPPKLSRKERKKQKFLEKERKEIEKEEAKERKRLEREQKRMGRASGEPAPKASKKEKAPEASSPKGRKGSKSPSKKR